VVDRQPDRSGDLSQVVHVDVSRDPAAAQPGQHPGPAVLVIGLGSGQRPAQLQPAHLDGSLAGQQQAVLERDDVDVVQDRHREGQSA
jgi:hypothetical protein